MVTMHDTSVSGATSDSSNAGGLKNSRHFITPGVSKPIFEAIKKKSIPARERLCVLLLDEIDLAPHLDYLPKEDYIIGFEDTGWSRNQLVADTALVFMLRSIYGNWKQPVAFAFHDYPLNQKTQIRFIKEIAKEAKQAGLNLIALVCTHCDHNVKAIDCLLEESKSAHTIDLDGHQVVPLLDPGSLLLVTRNLFCENNLQFVKDGISKLAQWQHLVQAHKIDSERSNYLAKITKSHLLPESMNLTKCVQTLSGTFAGFLNTIAGKTSLPVEATQTADLLFFLDKVLDSLNGTMEQDIHKPLRGPITELSPHSKFWSEAREVFKQMTLPGGDRGNSFAKWVRTFDAFEVIKEKILGLGYDSFPARSFNLEPLQNCFDLLSEQAGSTGCENRLTCKKFSVFYNLALRSKDMASRRATEPKCEPDGLNFLLTVEDLS